VTGELVVVRHADTDWSESGQHTGHTDLHLNARGVARAGGIAARLAGRSFAAVWCSPLARAVETCEIAGFAAAAQLRPELVEWNYGAYEGITSAEVHASRPDWDLWRDGCPGGEDAADVGARAEAALAALPEEGDALVFSHGHFLRVLVACWLGLGAAAGELFLLAPAGIGVLGHERERRVIVALG
jgi:probable phosphoglycerate mutase